MGSRGPAPKSERMKKLAGTDRKDRERHEPQLEREAPECPESLCEEAREEWARIVPVLDEAGMLTQLDRAALAAYCHAWAEWQSLDADIQENGLYQTTQSGYEQKRPAAAARDGAIDRCYRFAKEFGFTPKARSGLDVPPPPIDEDNPYALLGMINRRNAS